MPRLTAASSLDLSAITSPRPAHFPPWTSGSVARGCLPQPLAYRSPPPLCNRDRRSHRPRQDGPVKAVTGVDTDRWEEEKRRGITIDLGFAPLPLDDAIQASVVDVPGHEGFVRNMLAGATGIDVALLVIAADEGIMPQTEEHLAIVELLGVRRGIPVITKRDLVEPDWLDLVRSEVSTRLGKSRVRWDPAVATSVVTGEGLPELREALRRGGRGLGERPAAALVRLAI